MGQAKQKQISDQAFLQAPENQHCCFCGAQASTVDHFPPRTVFKKRHWPEGYRYPACTTCNAAKSRDEQSIALLVRLMGFDDPLDEELRKIAKSVVNNNPKLLSEMSSEGYVASKNYLRTRFGSPQTVSSLGVTGWKVVKLGPETERLFGRLCVWFAQTGYFKHVGAIFRGEVIWARLPVEHIHNQEVEQLLHNLVGQPIMMRSGKDISDQFFYKYFSQDGIFVAFMQFTRRPQFVFVVCAVAGEHVIADSDLADFWQRSGMIGYKPIQ